MRIVTWLLVVAGLALAAFGVITAVGQAASGAQPWSNELSDNFVFIKALPFVLAFGFAVGMLMARSYGPKVRSDGAVRRWSPGTVFGHAVLEVSADASIRTHSRARRIANAAINTPPSRSESCARIPSFAAVLATNALVTKK